MERSQTSSTQSSHLSVLLFFVHITDIELLENVEYF